MTKRKVLSAFSLLMILASCAKDMNSDDYKTYAFQRDLARVRGAEGVYTGPLISNSTSPQFLGGGTSYLGALQVTMTAGTQEVGGTDQTKASAQPVLMAEFEFQGTGKASVKSLNAFYDPASGTYKTTVSVKRPNQPDSIIYINGAIGSDGTFNGTIDAVEGSTGHQGYGAKFHLVRGGPSADQLNHATKPNPRVFWTQENYVGSMQFLVADKITHQVPDSQNVSLVLTQPSTNSDADFLSIFLPTKQVYGTLSFGDGVRIPFTNLIYDQDTGKLTGETKIDQTFSTSLGSPRYFDTLKLSCTRNGKGFGCDLANSTQPAGKVAFFVPSADPTEPSNQGNTKTEIRLYKGRGLFPLATDMSSQQKHWRDITFSVAYPSRTRLEEIYEYFMPLKEKWMTVSFTTPYTGVSFTAALYDTQSSTLTAQQSITVGGVPAQESLSCQNYVFADTSGPNRKPYKFTCTYLTTANNVEIPLELPARR